MDKMISFAHDRDDEDLESFGISPDESDRYGFGFQNCDPIPFRRFGFVL